MAAVLPDVVGVHNPRMELAIGQLRLLMSIFLGSEDVVHVAEIPTIILIADVSGGRSRVDLALSLTVDFNIFEFPHNIIGLINAFGILRQVFPGSPDKVRFAGLVELIVMVFVEGVDDILNVDMEVLVS